MNNYCSTNSLPLSECCCTVTIAAVIYVIFLFTIKEICQLYDVGWKEEPVADNSQKGKFTSIFNHGLEDRDSIGLHVNLCISYLLLILCMLAKKL